MGLSDGSGDQENLFLRNVIPDSGSDVARGAWDVTVFKKPEIILNFLFLGVGANALGFFLWNLSAKWIGAIKMSVYIYVSPVVTVVLSVVILHEKMTFVSVTGALLILRGLIVSQKKINQKK